MFSLLSYPRERVGFVLARATPVKSRKYGKYFCVLVSTQQGILRPVGDRNAEFLNDLDVVQVKYKEVEGDKRLETVKCVEPTKVIEELYSIKARLAQIVKSSLSDRPTEKTSCEVIKSKGVSFIRVAIKASEDSLEEFGGDEAFITLDESNGKRHTFKVKDRILAKYAKDTSIPKKERKEHILNVLKDSKYLVFSGHRNFNFFRIWMLVGVISI